VVRALAHFALTHDQERPLVAIGNELVGLLDRQRALDFLGNRALARLAPRSRRLVDRVGPLNLQDVLGRPAAAEVERNTATSTTTTTTGLRSFAT
jgi:hypothetical protein